VWQWDGPLPPDLPTRSLPLTARPNRPSPATTTSGDPMSKGQHFLDDRVNRVTPSDTTEL